jgi:uncharacterized BrkB/YihY/UPF0761 family membrane protein
MTKRRVFEVRRDILLLLLGIFLSFSVQVVYDAVKEYPAFQNIPLTLRLNSLAVVFGMATLVLFTYYLWNEVRLSREKSS